MLATSTGNDDESTGQPGKRVALVIGNGGYKDAPLANPANDARSMATALRELNFRVIEGIDLGLGDFQAKVDLFSNEAEAAQAALFFFAGHGFQLDGDNYFVPVDARLDGDKAIQDQAIKLQGQLDGIAQKAAIGIMLLDCCRDNPFVRSMARTRSLRPFDGHSPGLATVNKSGVFFAFSTAPGTVASDGERGHSPFTAAILRHIKEKRLSLDMFMRKVTRDVEEATAGKQCPWASSSLIDTFYFNPSRKNLTEDVARFALGSWMKQAVTDARLAMIAALVALVVASGYGVSHASRSTLLAEVQTLLHKIDGTASPEPPPNEWAARFEP
jgi:uncharacterized caspase-like protein